MLFYNYDYETLIQRPWGSAYLCLFRTIEASYNGRYKSANNWHFSDYRWASKNLLNNGGWHFSFFGTVDKIKEKISHYAHQEYNTDAIVNDDYIKGCITNMKAIEQGDTMVHKSLELNRHILPNNIDVLIDALKNKAS